MTKFVKYLMIGAGACLISGIGLSAAGWAMGGEPGYWIRKNGFYTNQDVRKELAGKYSELEKTRLDSFDNMDIRVDYNHINIKPSSDDKYYMEYRLYTRNKDPEYRVENEVLTLTCEMDQVTFYNKDGQITYDGPEAKALNLTSKFGGIDLSNPTAETASLNLSDGNLKCTGGTFTELTVINKYGNIICDTITADSFAAKQSDGTCTLRDADIRDGRFENKYGNINLDLSGAESDYNYDLTVKYGSIALNNRKYGEKDLVENNGATKNITTVSNDGNVNIRTK